MKEIYDIIKRHTGKRVEFDLTEKKSAIKGRYNYYIRMLNLDRIKDSIELLDNVTKEAEKKFPVKDCFIIEESGDYVLIIETTSLHKRVTRPSMKVLLGLQ